MCRAMNGSNANSHDSTIYLEKSEFLLIQSGIKKDKEVIIYKHVAANQRLKKRDWEKYVFIH